MNIKRHHWRHFFGGVGLVFLVLQFLSGIFLIFFYRPDLSEAYASVQYLYQHMPIGAWLRDTHRWLALFLFVSIIVHLTRSLLRKEFLNYKRRTIWLTGSLLLLPMLAFLVTGFILPWEWKGYWFMEMVPNYFGTLPYVGPPIKEFLISVFTLNRAFVVHILLLPVITLVLIDIHTLSMVRKKKGGIPRYLLKHSMLTLPFFIIITLLAIYIPMPTQDPEIIPMPLEGAFIPAPEWFILFLLGPFMHFKGFMATFLGLYLPLVFFILLAALPYYLKNRTNKSEISPHISNRLFDKAKHLFGIAFKARFATRAIAFLGVFIVVISLLSPLYMSTYESPTLGCNSCHNTSMGMRMGVPPKAFKDRDIVPLLDDNEWMVKHWFYPTVTW
ncbi:MAG: cytochrome b N-terminal domain-containing protein [Pseudomonadota bacterium]